MPSAPDPRIDAFIAAAQPFAQPILHHLRTVVHAAVPDLEETIKWGAPAFLRSGRIVCIFQAFKAHCSLVFWAPEMREILAADGIVDPDGRGHIGKITSLKDLPGKTALKRYFVAAAQHAANPTKRPTRQVKPAPETPPELTAALQLKQHAKAAAIWADASPSMRREYIEWITEAKQAATRERRLTTTLEWLADGKPRNWKYQNC